MPSFVVGAYASLPQGREAQETYYDLLGEQPWIEGTELPFPGDLADTADRIWLAGHLPKHWRGNTVTVIPGTMQHVWKDPNFGLASPDEDGRKVALAFMKQLREALADFAQWRASQDVKFHEDRQPRRHGRLARGPRAAGLVRCQAGDRALRQVRRGAEAGKGLPAD